MPNNSTTPASAARRQKLLAVLVRAPEDGYPDKEVAKALYPMKNKRGGLADMQCDLRHLEGYGLGILHDFGRIGVLNRDRYLDLPLEVVLNENIN